MGKTRLLVLDVLKPHEPSIIKLSSILSDIEGIDGVDITVYEIDKKVENVKITMQGRDIRYESVREIIDENGATIHSIDKVSSGSKIIEEAQTHQDSHS